ncbi:protein-L-isoaspartate(D-aspartate) O-methyltransferase [Paenibacillus rhizosphaerae]|uniref:Protein-L-isoaspartate O-methyltransferase n=1 Tax=Paenibacillus rhizosphaerae TaxID=297318 RepID=A0A839TSD3_9BACL|nr:methyltransferase domain-containing protein [Paenibacillus rhizosphaerae]MBB3129451.1 protein-L-isoaspartate(D-aspartate) O-methyltransferase [Paenibacillus rhizosphaerae]
MNQNRSIDLYGLHLSPSIINAFEHVNGAQFLFHQDGSRVIQSTNPRFMAEMLECLQVQKGMRVLEIGTGSGFNAALISNLIGPEGTLHTVEVDPSVAKRAKKKLDSSEIRNVKVICGDGFYGFHQSIPYDRIIAAAKPPFLPQPWIDQLGIGGILVAPLDLEELGDAYVVAFNKVSEHSLVSLSLMKGNFMRMAPSVEQLVLKSGKPNVVLTDFDIDRLQIRARRNSNRKNTWMDQASFDAWDFEYIGL